MPIERQRPLPQCFNPAASLPFELRIEDFSLALQDVYDFFFDVNSFLLKKGLQRLDDMLRPAIISARSPLPIFARIREASLVRELPRYIAKEF